MAPGQANQAGKMWEDKLLAVNAWLAGSPVVVSLAEKAGVQPWMVAAAGVTWASVFLFWGYTSELVCMVVAHLYPMYASFKALDDEQHVEVHEWLVYWVTFSALSLAEGLLRGLFVWLPFYHILRLCFLFWLFLPATRGAQVLYRWAVGPLLRYYRPTVDAAIQRSTEDMHCHLRKEISDVLRSAVPCSGDSNLAAGIQDLVVQQLKNAATGHVSKVSGMVQASPSPARAAGASRTRTASPRPSWSKQAPLPEERDECED